MNLEQVYTLIREIMAVRDGLEFSGGSKVEKLDNLYSNLLNELSFNFSNLTDEELGELLYELKFLGDKFVDYVNCINNILRDRNISKVKFESKLRYKSVSDFSLSKRSKKVYEIIEVIVK